MRSLRDLAKNVESLGRQRGTHGPTFPVSGEESTHIKRTRDSGQCYTKCKNPFFQGQKCRLLLKEVVPPDVRHREA